jgi:uncharacterized protein
MIIDCHTHLNHYEDESRDALDQQLEKLRSTMRRNRVDVSVILTSFKDVPGRPSTARVVEAVRPFAELRVVAGLNYDTFGEHTVDELRGFLERKEIVGLKLYPGYQYFYPPDEKWAPAYRLAEEFGVPVMIHSGDTYSPRGKVKYAHPLHVDEVAVDFPQVKFVICHLGNPWFRDTMEVVYKNENVYTDISGLVLGDFHDRFEKYMRAQMQEMLLWGVNPRYVLYGTDWPISSMESYLTFIEEIKMPLKDRKRILYENAAELYGIPVKNETSGLGSLFR